MDDAGRWAQGLDGLVERIAPRFRRVEPRRRAVTYLKGLLAPVECKNGWQLAEATGDSTPDGMQDFLARMLWDADAVRDDLRAYVVEHLGDTGAVLVLDETGFLCPSGDAQRQEGHEVGRRAAAVLGHGGPHRKLPDRGLSRLCQLPRPCLDRPRALSSRKLGR
jgi:hypothetical protein